MDGIKTALNILCSARLKVKARPGFGRALVPIGKRMRRDRPCGRRAPKGFAAAPLPRRREGCNRPIPVCLQGRNRRKMPPGRRPKGRAHIARRSGGRAPAPRRKRPGWSSSPRNGAEYPARSPPCFLLSHVENLFSNSCLPILTVSTYLPIGSLRSNVQQFIMYLPFSNVGLV